MKRSIALTLNDDVWLVAYWEDSRLLSESPFLVWVDAERAMQEWLIGGVRA